MKVEFEGSLGSIISQMEEFLAQSRRTPQADGRCRDVVYGQAQFDVEWDGEVADDTD